METDTQSLRESCISVRLLARRIKGGSAAGEVRVTDAHPGGGILVTDAEGKDKEGGDTEHPFKMEQPKSSFLIKVNRGL